VLQSLTHYVSGSPWTYAFLVFVCAFDVLIPVLPSETSVILGGTLAAAGHLNVALVFGAAALGAIAGDNLAYAIGRYGGKGLTERIRRGKRREQLEWAERQVQQRGPYLVLIGRFIPGGRTVVTLTCGAGHMAWPRFLLWDAIAGCGWAAYATALGYLGGRAFEREPWKGFLLAFGIALAVTGIVELVRAVRRRRAASSA
jgi:membrane protein DedA with SNARE-associated domain